VPATAVFADRARRFTGLAFIGSFAAGEESLSRRFAITEDLRHVPVTKVKPDGGSPFHGVEISGKDELPFAWVRKEVAKLYEINKDEAKAIKQKPKFRSIVQLTGKTQSVGRRLYHELKDGPWIRTKSLGIAAEPDDKPRAAKRGDKWVDIAIRQQVLVLWEGDQPVYATLVSTGQDLLGDPKTTKSTVRGTFRVQNKHITRTMDSDEGLSRDSGDEAYGKSKRRGQGSYRLDHVPWVQYFKGSYALHATHWHDVFGTARSHGCINMAPVDAHRVFFWTEPQVPEGWHGVYANDEHKGTVVHIHE
jgi:lipoprotein-anchoring transpeptidase ErfK/SrfK